MSPRSILAGRAACGARSPTGCNFNSTVIQGIAIVILFLQVTERGRAGGAHSAKSTAEQGLELRHKTACSLHVPETHGGTLPAFPPCARTESQSAGSSQAVWPLTLSLGVVRLACRIPVPIPQSTLVGVELGADSSLRQGDCLISPRMLPQLGWPTVASQQSPRGLA